MVIRAVRTGCYHILVCRWRLVLDATIGGGQPPLPRKPWNRKPVVPCTWQHAGRQIVTRQARTSPSARFALEPEASRTRPRDCRRKMASGAK